MLAVGKEGRTTVPLETPSAKMVCFVIQGFCFFYIPWQVWQCTFHQEPWEIHQIPSWAGGRDDRETVWHVGVIFLLNCQVFSWFPFPAPCGVGHTCIYQIYKLLTLWSMACLSFFKDSRWEWKYFQVGGWVYVCVLNASVPEILIFCEDNGKNHLPWQGLNLPVRCTHRRLMYGKQCAVCSI